jgi:hypothetical protein
MSTIKATALAIYAFAMQHKTATSYVFTFVAGFGLGAIWF